mgnify:FL=1
MVEETEATKEEISIMVNRTLVELEVITTLVNQEDFDFKNSNYDLKFHYRVMGECITMLREMLLGEYNSGK